ncbi:hypothetical protein LOK49_LG05G01249 [Camellia lanceoleosa]|uniref:Uncharacterized protein n=1 Tax=Camellia lanceoleosa TaxID=1840588 RepID=A0ACC0HUE8_9ERIC|nr:hypothetical protein LOK49_LG05G01249 [Camellia lanceoleosa]
MRCGDLNAEYFGEIKGGVERFHGGEEVGDEGFVSGGDDFVPDSDAVDFGGGIEGEDVVSHPGHGGGEFGDGRDVGVGDGDGDVDVGVGEGAEDVGVGVEDLDSVDGGLVFDEGGDLGRWREVVGHRAVVDADGVSRRGLTDEEAANGEEDDKFR